MGNIFIVSTPLFGYLDQVKSNLSKMGFCVSSAGYRIPSRYLYKLPVVGKLYQHWFLKRENARIKEIILRTSNIDVIVFFGMSEFSVEELRYIKEATHSKIVFWFIDSIYAFKNYFDGIAIADELVCYNQHESEALKEQGFNSSFQPLFFDPSYYFPIEGSKKERDIFFIGALKSRISYLNELFRQLDDLKLNIEVYGKLSPLYILMNRRRYPYFFKFHRNANLTHTEINKHYNSSALCLNLQPVQAVTALNIRTFEVCGSGGMLFTDGNRELIEDLFTIGQDLVYFRSLEEAVLLIRDFYGDKRLNSYDIIRRNASMSSLEKHTLQKRLESIFGDLEKVER